MHIKQEQNFNESKILNDSQMNCDKYPIQFILINQPSNNLKKSSLIILLIFVSLFLLPENNSVLNINYVFIGI